MYLHLLRIHTCVNYFFVKDFPVSRKAGSKTERTWEKGQRAARAATAVLTRAGCIWLTKVL